MKPKENAKIPQNTKITSEPSIQPECYAPKWKTFKLFKPPINANLVDPDELCLFCEYSLYYSTFTKSAKRKKRRNANDHLD